MKAINDLIKLSAYQMQILTYSTNLPGIRKRGDTEREQETAENQMKRTKRQKIDKRGQRPKGQTVIKSGKYAEKKTETVSDKNARKRHRKREKDSDRKRQIDRPLQREKETSSDIRPRITSITKKLVILSQTAVLFRGILV